MSLFDHDTENAQGFAVDAYEPTDLYEYWLAEWAMDAESAISRGDADRADMCAAYAFRCARELERRKINGFTLPPDWWKPESGSKYV